MFCHKCGSKLAEGELFCSQCGSKVPEIIETDNSIEQKIEPITHEITNDSEEERIINLLNKHLKGIVESEKQLLMVPQDEQIINAFPADVIERYTSQKPLLVFNYMNDGLKDGFVITATEFVSIYGDRKKTFLLKDLEVANLFKAGLATVMTIFTFKDGRTTDLCTPDLYLTSIRDIKKLLSGINSFLFELNQKEVYDEQESKIKAKDLKTILSSVFKDYSGDYTYCSIGTPLSAHHSKYKAAVKNFNIDSSAEIYMIYDESILGNCKKGFLVTYQGIYYKQKDTVGYISWEEFKELKLSAGLVFSIGKLEFATLKKDCNIAYTTLSNLQNMLKD